MSTKQKTTKSERLDAAREQAKKVRENQIKAQKRKKVLTVLTVVVVIVAILSFVSFMIVNSTAQNSQVADVGPAPANVNKYGGAVLLSKETLKTQASVGEVDVKSVSNPSAQDKPQGVLTASPAEGQRHQVVLYVDLQCPSCSGFETANGSYIEQLADSGAVDVEYRVLGGLDSQSKNMYSSRAANAVYCVADKVPNKYGEYLKKLFKEQPGERTAGPSNDELIQKAGAVGAPEAEDCIRNEDFKTYVKYVTSIAGIFRTPTVYVDGQLWAPGSNAFPAFANAVDSRVFPLSGDTINMPSENLEKDIKIEEKK